MYVRSNWLKLSIQIPSVILHVTIKWYWQLMITTFLCWWTALPLSQLNVGYLSGGLMHYRVYMYVGLPMPCTWHQSPIVDSCHFAVGNTHSHLWQIMTQH